MHNERISEKKQFIMQQSEEGDYLRLKSMVDKSQSRLKKNKRRQEEMNEHKLMRMEQD